MTDKAKSMIKVVVAVVVVILFTVLIGWWVYTNMSDSGGDNVEITVPATEPDDSSYQDTDVDREEYQTIQDQDALTRFAAEFSTVIVPAHDDEVESWVETVQPMMTGEIVNLVENVDPMNIPVGSPMGTPYVVEYGDNYAVFSAEYLMTGGTGTMEVRYMVIQTDDGWKVNEYQTNQS